MSKLSKFAAACAAAVLSVSTFGAETVVWVNAAATPAEPYDTVESGFTNLTDAVAYQKALETDDAKVIKVKDGTYADSGITLDFPVRIEGVCDEGKTASFNHVSARVLTLDDDSAVVTGLRFSGTGNNNKVTVKKGSLENCSFTSGNNVSSASVFVMSGGHVSGCLFAGNVGYGAWGAATARISGGVMTNCVFRGENHMETVVFLTGGVFTDSVITNCNRSGTGHANLGNNAMVLNGTGRAERILVWKNGSTADAYCGNGSTFGKNGRQPGAVTVAKGTLANSLVYGNYARDYPGVSVYDGGRVVNCTIGACGGKGASAATGLNLLQYGGEVVNTIIYGDTTSSDFGYAKSGGTVKNSIFANAAHDDGKSGNVVKDPIFTDAAAGNFVPSKLSPCRDAGAEDAAMANVPFDFAGNDRVQSGVIDIGCYELKPLGPEDVEVLVERTASKINDDYTQTVTFWAHLIGGTADGFAFAWTEDETALGDTEYLTKTFKPGVHFVTVTCTKGDVVKTDTYRLAVYPRIMYISPSGSGEAPYATMETAIRNIADLEDVMADAGDLYHEYVLSNGTHKLSAAVNVSKACTFRAADGGRATVDCQNGAGYMGFLADCRVKGIDFTGMKNSFKVTAGRVEDCTFKRGNSFQGGKGVEIAGTAVVDNVWVKDFVGGWSNQRAVTVSGSAQLLNAVISNCGYNDSALTVYDNAVCSNIVIRGTTSPHEYATNLAQNSLEINGGLVTHAVITNNGNAASTYQGTVRVLGGTLRNSLVVDNKCPDTAGIYVSGQGRVENCTVIANREAGKNARGDALRQVCGTVVNSAFVSSFAADGQPGTVQTGGTMSHSRTDEPIAGERNTTDPVKFVTRDGWPYMPVGKPLVNGGVKLDWMDNETDLLCRPRIYGAKPDIGCVESPYLPGLTLIVR